MVVRVIETGRTETLSYRAWDGIRYGQNEAENIVRQYLDAPFDRAHQAYVMSKKDYSFWRQYFRHLESDAKLIRDMYQKYRASDVETALKLELDIAGDDPARHHKARRNALRAIREKCEARPERTARAYPYDEQLCIRFSAVADGDLIDLLQETERNGLKRAAELKRYIRLGLEYERQIAAQREADIQTLRDKGWL